MLQRIQVKLSTSAAEMLRTTAEELESTQTGVVADGVRVVRAALTAAKAGGNLAIVGADGRVSYLLGPWNDVGPRPAA